MHIVWTLPHPYHQIFKIKHLLFIKEISSKNKSKKKNYNKVVKNAGLSDPEFIKIL